MAKRIAISNLNASTLDILNTIRANASAEYQELVPEIEKPIDIPRVGEVLYGYPAMANQFINTLVNRIALFRINSATFNNPYSELKKGYLEYGETVEDSFVDITKAREFNVEKAPAREFQRTIPDVKTAFHVMNYRVQYPITIQDEDLRRAFLSEAGVQDLINRIVQQVYTAAEYDEYLLFKYVMIKAISHGQMYPVPIDSSDMKKVAESFRGHSNDLTFMKTKYNISGVHNVTPKSDQYIFMDSFFNAAYDVQDLASAFNMDKIDFIGRLKLIDDWTTFDSDRFSIIINNSEGLEPITAEELALMANVKAVLVDKEWFQFYDNLNRMSETFVSTGLYWNYNYNVWKTISTSPFSNAIVFVDDGASTTLPTNVTVEIRDKSISDAGTIFTLYVDTDTPGLVGQVGEFVQTSDATEKGIAVHPYGAVIFPVSQTTTTLEMDVGGTRYKATAALTTAATTGQTLIFSPQA